MAVSLLGWYMVNQYPEYCSNSLIFIPYTDFWYYYYRRGTQHSLGHHNLPLFRFDSEYHHYRLEQRHELQNNFSVLLCCTPTAIWIIHHLDHMRRYFMVHRVHLKGLRRRIIQQLNHKLLHKQLESDNSLRYLPYRSKHRLIQQPSLQKLSVLPNRDCLQQLEDHRNSYHRRYHILQ